jgi:hypothetical protein
MVQKAQSALEFLTTYGWAFLVILIMIGALAYFGVLNPTRYLPERCSVDVGFECTEFSLVKSETDEVLVTFYLKNNLAETIEISRVFMENIEYLGEGISSSLGVSINPGTSERVITDLSVLTDATLPAAGSKIKLVGTITYKPSGKQLDKKMNIEIFGALQ